MTRIWARILVATACIIGIAALFWVSIGQLEILFGGNASQRLNAKDRLDEIGNIQGRLVALLSSGAIGGGLYYTGRKYFLDRDKQYTDRFSTAVDHLSSAEETLRAGGVRALDRILHDSPTDRNRALKSLTGFLRKQAPTDGGEDRDDITAALEALRDRGKAPRRYPESPLDLHGVRLGRVDLSTSSLRGADLTRADFTGADLTHSDLTGAYLNDATLIAANLAHATLVRAHLSRARLTKADLTGAGLAGADLTGADLSGGTMRNTDLTGAVLIGTNLRGTDLRHTTGLTTEQLNHALADQRTRIPGNIDDTSEGP